MHDGSVRWAQSLGMLPTERHVRTAHKAKAGWLAARAFPTATQRGLQLAADWTTLFCILDDHTEKLSTADALAAYLQHLLELFRADVAGSFEDPFAAGMRDLRQRLLALASPSHLAQFADRIAEMFAAHVAEARNRERGQIPSVASYLQLREVTIGVRVLFSLAEVVEGFRLSEGMREHPALRRLATRASHIVGWANDLFTFEKQIIQGETHNLVLVLMNERQLTIAGALQQAVALHDEEVRSFLEEVEYLPRAGVTGADVRRYVEMLSCCIRGHLDWAHETGRYRPYDAASEQSNPPAGRPATA